MDMVFSWLGAYVRVEALFFRSLSPCYIFRFFGSFKNGFICLFASQQLMSSIDEQARALKQSKENETHSQHT